MKEITKKVVGFSPETLEFLGIPEEIKITCDACEDTFWVEKRFASNYGHLCDVCAEAYIQALEEMRLS